MAESLIQPPADRSLAAAAAPPAPAGGPKLPLDVGLAKALVDAAVKLTHSLSEGRRAEPAYQDLVVSARALHVEVAGAEYDSKLPQRPIRSGAHGEVRE